MPMAVDERQHLLRHFIDNGQVSQEPRTGRHPRLHHLVICHCKSLIFLSTQFENFDTRTEENRLQERTTSDFKKT